MNNVVQIKKYQRRQAKLRVGKIWVWTVFGIAILQTGIIFLLLGRH